MFDKLIKKYKLTKTLRFELVPIDDTKNLFDNNGKNILQQIVEKDQKIDTWYNTEMKPLFDDLHETYITQRLSNLKFEGKYLECLKNINELQKQLYDKNRQLSELKKSSDKNKSIIKEIEKEIVEIEGKCKDKENKGKLSQMQKTVRKYIVKKFDGVRKLWSEIYKDIKDDDDEDEDVDDLLKDIIDDLMDDIDEDIDSIDDDIKKIISSIDSFTGWRKYLYYSNSENIQRIKKIFWW